MPAAVEASLDRVERQLLAAAASRDRAMRSDLAAWVAIPTGWGDPAGIEALRHEIARRLEAIGGELRLEAGDPRPEWLQEASGGSGISATLVARGGEGRQAFLLSGHLDTVHDPAGPFRSLQPCSGERATGPGCADMKGGLLVAVTALELLHAAGIPLRWTFLLNADEESGSFHSARSLREHAAGHAAGLVFEPALPGGRLAISRMGSAQFRLRVRGRAAHVGRDFASGVSAVYGLAGALQRLASLSSPSAGRIVNVGPICGGTATNVVPESAAAWGNARFTDAESQRLLEEAVLALATADGQCPQVLVEWLASRPAKPETPAVRALAAEVVAIGGALGAAIETTATGGVCDGNNLQAAGLPVIDTLGVRGGNLHRPDEFIELDSLVERAALAAILLKRLAEGRVDLPA